MTKRTAAVVRLRVELGNSGKTQFDSIRSDYPVHCYIVASLIDHSFHTVFTNCERVKCIILRFIHTFKLELTLNLCDVIIK